MLKRLSPAPDIGEVAGQFAGHQENGVDSDIFAGTGVTRGEALGGDGDTAEPVLVQRHGRRVFASPLLDLDERDGPTALGNQVDLSSPNARAASENSPAVKAQPPGGYRLGPAPPRFGDLPIQSEPPSSSARE
jgi:hypothetical protein